MKHIIMLSLLVMAGFANAEQVYICTDANGKKQFQQRPCQENTKSEEKVFTADMVGTNMESLDFDEEDKNMEIRQLNRDISASRSRISGYQKSLRLELDALRSKKRYANNNLAGAQWEDSISNEMNAVSAKWDSMIRVEQSNLDNLRSQLADLKSELKESKATD